VSKPRLLVATSVHHPDDARIRAKLIATLAAEWDVSYAAPEPGPVDTSDLSWIPLTGRRSDRTIRATRLMLRDGWDLVAIHDPELLLGGLIRSRRGQATLFDLHENLPSQLRIRDRVPVLLRSPLAAAASWVLRLAETTMAITLAEDGYQSLFRARHPVIANYLPESLPDPQPAADPPFLAYLGDVTVVRGAFVALEAAAGAGYKLVMVGRVAPPSLVGPLTRRAEELGVDMELTGPLPHSEALARIAAAAAGLSPLLDIGNYRHSLPTKVPEYLALGLPVLASDLPGTRSPMDGLEGVRFIEAGDGSRWKAEGQALAEDPERRARVADQVDVVKQRFTWPSEDVLAVYRKAAQL
jgi:glycosyltransferase involved in cell wall biosynthesis